MSSSRLWDEEEEHQKPLSWSLIRRLAGYFGGQRRQVLTAVLFLLLSVGVHLLQPILVRTAVRGYVEQAPEPDRTFRILEGLRRSLASRVGLAIPGLLFVVGLLVLNGLLRWVFEYVTERTSFRLGQAVAYRMRMDIFSHLQKLSLSFFERTKQGRIIARATSDLHVVEEMLGGSLITAMWIALILTGAMVIMFLIDWKLALATAAVLPALILATEVFRRKVEQAFRRIRVQVSRITSNLAENIAGMRVVQAFSRQQENLSTFDELNRTNYELGVRAARIFGVYFPGINFISTVGMTIVFGYGGARMAAGELGVGDLLAFMFLVNMFYGPIREMGWLFNTTLSAMAAGERIFALLDTEPEVSDLPVAIPIPRIAGHVRFEDVTFSYDDGSLPVLRELNLEARPAETVALVGPTGAGKSTLVKLLARFYDPQWGRILVDGKNIKEATLESLHSQMGIVLQESFLFSGTVMENIKYGRPGVPDEEVVELAKILGSHEVIANLPQGYQTEVQERGQGLSQGERQLICFTRALVADPRILILDEATSAVDVQMERRLQHALRKLLAHRTGFVVAHRLSTVRGADQVLVLADGRIVERGTHGSLLEAGGRYARMYAEFSRGE